MILPEDEVGCLVNVWIEVCRIHDPPHNVLFKKDPVSEEVILEFGMFEFPVYWF